MSSSKPPSQQDINEHSEHSLRQHYSLPTTNDQHFQLILPQLPPLPHRQVIQPDVHDADTLQGQDFKAQVFTHSANLPIEALGEDDAETVLA